MTTAILNALSILTKPHGEPHVSGAQPTQQGALLAALQANQAELRERLQADEGLEEACLLLEEVRGEVRWACSATVDLTWSFVQECLLLLLCLARHLTRLLEAFTQAAGCAQRNPRTPEAAPALPPDVLSVAQQKSLGAGLQFVVTLGLCPYLAPGVGLALGRRSAFGATVEGAVRRDVAPACDRRLLITTSTLLELSVLSSLATLVYTRHLGDVMAALCQLGYCPHRPEGASTENDKTPGLSMEERRSYREQLQRLLGKVYQPIVIKELLVLQGGPKQAPPDSRGGAGGARTPLPPAPAWLRRLCGQLLSERLMQPNGVQAVVRAILEGTGAGGDSDWRKCEAVARILAACPQQSLSAERYYSQVCPQVLELLHFRDKLTAQQFQRVATRAALTMVQERPEFAQLFLLTPLLAPLYRCGAITGGGQEQATVQEWELTRCVEDVFKICVVGNSPCDALLRALGDVVPVVFSLYCFTKQNVSHLRAPCQEVLLWYLTRAEPSVSLSSLKQLCGLSGEEGGVVPGLHFSPGSEGGARLTLREPISDEDDSLYEKVSGEQWRVECLVQLLAEMKDSDLPGEFFLRLLQDLTDWAAEPEEEVEQEEDASTMSLVELEQHLFGCASVRGRRLALLQALALMCECLPHTLLLRKPTQVVEFVVSMLQRACVCLERGSEGPVESQTLSMGMGLVATLLSGAAELSAEDYSFMSKLLPPLEQISQQHPEPVIQELASDLRVAITTRGAYHPETLTRGAYHPETLTRGAYHPETLTRGAYHPETLTRGAYHPETLTRGADLPETLTHAASQPTAHSNHILQTNKNSTTSPKNSQGTHTHQTNKPSPIPQVHPLSPSSQNSHSGPAPQTTGPQQPRQSCIPGLRGTGPPREEAHQTQSSSTAQQASPGPGRGVSGPARGQSEGSIAPVPPVAPPSRAFSECLLEACDPDVPTRAVALRALTRTIQEGDREALQAQEKVLTLFLENVEHEDSFVYLSAIQGLAVLADSFPEQVLQRLLGEFQGGSSLASARGDRSLETRLKVGEALMRASRAMGDLAPHYGRPLIGAFLSGTRDEDSSMRASCLSNLGELCQRLHFALGPLAQELSTCVTALIKTEREVEVRRAAVHVIALLLRGLSDKTTQILGDVLLDLYRALKWAVRSDPDDVTVLHAQLALEELDDVMRSFIFPQQKLEKKIVVLP